MNSDDNLILRMHMLEKEIERLHADLALAEQQRRDLEDTRKAMLYMLEDLNHTAGQVEAAKEEWEETFDNVTDPIFLVDLEGNVLRANRALAGLAGKPIQECIGIPYRQLAPFNKPQHPNLPSQQAEEREKEIRIDGRTYLWHIYPVNNSGGQLLFFIHMMRDISERKLAEETIRKHQQETESALEGTIHAVAMAVEARDPYTAGHQKRVATLACAIAATMGIGSERIKGLRLGALIHDIGKIHTPAEILSKPATLSEIEYRLIKQHTMVGYDILKSIPFPWPIADIAKQHHERVDGSGYPSGLKGEEICLEARIVAVADVVEAISSHRPYRAALGKQQAMEEITQYRGQYYDPAVVDACISVINSEFDFDAM